MVQLLQLVPTIIEHRQNIKLSRQQLEAKNLKKFRKLVRFANQRSPFYARIIRENHINIEHCIPQDFPPLSKTDLLQNFDEIVTNPAITKQAITHFLSHSKKPSDLFQNQYYVVHSSGSSGETGYYVYSSKEWLKGLAHVFKFQPFRLKRRMTFVGASRGHFAGVTMAMSSQNSIARSFFDLQVLDIAEPIQDLVEKLNHFQPKTLVSYGSTLRILAEQQQAGKLKIQPQLIQSSGDALTLQNRLQIQDAFQAPVFNIYACSEHLLMGIGYPNAQELVLLEDDLMFDLHADHICITNLYNYTMPLIRYKMLDQLVLSESTDALHALPYTRVKNLVGRTEQNLILTNQQGENEYINPFVLGGLLIENLKQFQIKQTSRSQFIFRLQPAPNLSSIQHKQLFQDVHDALEQMLAEKMLTNVQFSIEEAELLAIDPHTGKFKLVVSE